MDLVAEEANVAEGAGLDECQPITRSSGEVAGAYEFGGCGVTD